MIKFVNLNHIEMFMDHGLRIFKLESERGDFVRFQARWVKSMPNEVWSKQQADLIDGFIESSQQLEMSPEQYLKIVDGRKRKRPER